MFNKNYGHPEVYPNYLYFFSLCYFAYICSYGWLISGSSRIVGLVQLLLKADVGKTVIEDYAACLEFRFDDFQVIEDTKDDVGVLILQVVILFPLTLFVELFNDLCFNYANQSYMQLLLDNICHPAPNITHLLLRFDVNGSIERTVLKPKSHYRLTPDCAFMCGDIFY